MIVQIDKIYTQSNLLSFFRLLLAIPMWFVLDYLQEPVGRYAAFSICILIAYTDIMDGRLARKYNEVTELGKIIDPLADKIAVAVIITKLFLLNLITPYYIILILLRDGLIFLGGVFVSKKLGKVLPSNIPGKIAVFNIGLVILLIILRIDQNSLLFKSFYYSSITLLYLSFSIYLFRAVQIFKPNLLQKK